MQQKKRRAVSSIKTLIVDDSPLIHASLGRFLGTLPYIQIVGSATNGVEALEQVDEREPNLVIMDFQMPKMDGLQASRLIREQHPEVRIILMTAHDLARVKAGVMADGPDAFLSKQYLTNELKATLARLFPEVAMDGGSSGQPEGSGTVEEPGGPNQSEKKARIPIRFLDPSSDLDNSHAVSDDGQPAKAETIQRIDIHIETEVERRLEARTSQLAKRIKELEAFPLAVARELRSPLRHIQNYAFLLQHRSDLQFSKSSSSFLQSISDLGVSSLALLDGLLALAKAERQELAMDRVNSVDLVTKAIAHFRPVVDGRAVEWKVADLPVVIGDAALLSQVFTNLIENSLKFTRTRERAEIEIGCADAQPGHKAFFVKDNGVGFRGDNASRLFEPFERLDRSAEFQGSGLGLAIARRIINRHGGKIWANAIANHSATIYFTLPAFAA